MSNEGTFPIAPIPKPSQHDLELEQQRQEPGGFGEWLKQNPEPSVDKLVEQFGGEYWKITPEAWAEFERQTEDWQQRYRLRNNTMPAPKGLTK
jgi:hypothetical protein